MSKSRLKIMFFIVSMLYIAIIILLANVFVFNKNKLSVINKMNLYNKNILNRNYYKMISFKKKSKKAIQISWILANNNRLSYSTAKKIVDDIDSCFLLLDDSKIMYIKKKKYIKHIKLLILSIMKTESTFRTNISSKIGAIGLMQIYPTNSILDYLNFCKPNDMKKITKKSLYYKHINIFSSYIMIDEYLQLLVNKYGDKKFNQFSDYKKVKLILSLYLGINSYNYYMPIYRNYKNLSEIIDKLE